MRYELGRLERENEIGCDLLRPGRKHALFRHVIECVVHFDRVEAAGIEPEHLLGLNLFRIECPFPFFMGKSARTDMDIHDFPPPAPDSFLCASASLW
jgi:hypothetical protein